MGLKGVLKPVFNISILQSLPSGSLVHICEGVPDALALEAHGLHAIAILGASSSSRVMNDECIQQLLGHRIVVLGDGDAPGRSFTNKVKMAFLEHGKAVQCMSLPEGKDVSDVLADDRNNP